MDKALVSIKILYMDMALVSIKLLNMDKALVSIEMDKEAMISPLILFGLGYKMREGGENIKQLMNY